MIEVLVGLKAFKQALQYIISVIVHFPNHKGLRDVHEKIVIEVQKADDKHIEKPKARYNKDQLLKKFSFVRPHLRSRTDQLERFKEKATKAVLIRFDPTQKKQRGLYAAKSFLANAIVLKEHKPVVFATLAVDDR